MTDVDPDNETYTGTVDETVEYDRTHEVCAWARHLTDDQQHVELCTLPDATTGAWTIDFTGVGRIVPGDHTGAFQVDADGDRTEYAWFVPPWIYVELGGDDFADRIELDQWAFPVTVTNGTETIEVSDTYGDGRERIEFDVAPGETITATGSDGKVKSLFLEELAVTAVTLWNEEPPSTVYGTTAAGYQGQVQVTASSDNSGWWTERWTNSWPARSRPTSPIPATGGASGTSASSARAEQERRRRGEGHTSGTPTTTRCRPSGTRRIRTSSSCAATTASRRSISRSVSL